MIPQAKQLKSSQEIRQAFNWLTTSTDNKGIELKNVYFSAFFVFKAYKSALINKEGDTKKALSMFISPPLHIDKYFLQNIPPHINKEKTTIEVYFFIDEWLYISIDNYNLTTPEYIEGKPVNPLVERPDPRPDKVEKLFYISLRLLFLIAIKYSSKVDSPTPSIDQPNETFTVQKGKSLYKLTRNPNGISYQVRRADNDKLLDPKSPRAKDVISELIRIQREQEL